MPSTASVFATAVFVGFVAVTNPIANVMNFSAGGGYTKIAITIVAFRIVRVVTYMFFVFGERFVKHISASARGAILRLMGLILAVVDTQIVIDGVHDAFPAV